MPLINKYNRQASPINSSLKKSRKIISFLVVFILVSTVASSVIAQAKIGDKKDSIKEKLNNLKERTQNLIEDISELKTRDKSDNMDREGSKTSRSSLIATFNTLSEFQTTSTSLNFYTNFNGIEKTSELKIFGSIDIDVDNDGDKDINAKLFLRPGIVSPFALSINFGLTINRLNGFGNVNAFFEVYAELIRPGIIDKDATGDKIRFGYQSPYGDRVPESCTITYKFVPNLLNVLKKPEHRAQVNPSSDVVGKENLILLMGYIDVSDGSTDDFRVAYSPAAKTEITFGRQGGKSFEFIRERVGSSKVDLYLTHIKNGNTTYAYVYDLPSQVSFVLDFGRDGVVEFDTHGEKASEIGICDDFDDPSFKLFFTGLPTKAGIEWKRRILQGNIEVSVYREGSDGVTFNLYIKGKNNTKFYGSCRVKATRDDPLTIKFGDGNGKARISLAGKSLEITDLELNLYSDGIKQTGGLLKKGTYSFGFDQFIKQKDGTIDIELFITGQEGTASTLDVTIKVENGVEIYDIKIGHNGSWAPAPPPFNEIVTDGTHTYHFAITLEGIIINIAEDKSWGYIVFQGSISLDSFHFFNVNGVDGAVKGIITIGSAGGELNFSWTTIDGLKVFNLVGLVLSLEDFVFWFGDMIYLSIPELIGNIQLVDASNESGQFIFSLNGEGATANIDFDFYFNFDEFDDIPDFELDLSIDDFHVVTGDTTATLELSWLDGNYSIVIDVDTNLDLNIERLDFYSFKQGNEPANDTYTEITNLYLDLVGNVGAHFNLTLPILTVILEDTDIYLHIDDFRQYNDTGAPKKIGILGEILADLEVIDTCNIHIIEISDDTIEGYWDVPEYYDEVLYWSNKTIGIETSNGGELIIHKLFVENIMGGSLDINEFTIEGYTEIFFSTGTLYFIYYEGVNEKNGAQPFFTHITITNDVSTEWYVETLYFNLSFGEFPITEDLEVDIALSAKLYNTILDAGTLDAFIRTYIGFSAELREGDAIEEVALGVTLIVDDIDSLIGEIILSSPVDYVFIDFNKGFNDINPPYHEYLIIDTNNNTISIDVYIRIKKDFMNYMIDLANDFLGTSLPHLEYDAGIRFDDISLLKADNCVIYINESVLLEMEPGSYLFIGSEGDIYILDENQWVLLFGDFDFTITLTPGHLKIEFLADVNNALVDYYNSAYDLTFQGSFSAGAGLIIDIYFDKLAGEIEIQINGDITIEDLLFSVGTKLSVTATSLGLDIDGTKAILLFDVNLNDLKNSTLSLDSAQAHINSLSAQDLEIFAEVSGIEISSFVIDCSISLTASAELSLHFDYPPTYFSVELVGSGSVFCDGDITAKGEKLEITIQDLYLAAGKLKLLANNVSNFFILECDATASWGYGVVKIIPKGLTFGFEGLGGDASVVGDLRFDWTGSLKSGTPSSVKFTSISGFKINAYPLIVTVNNEEILRLGLGIKIQGDIILDQMIWDANDKLTAVYIGSEAGFTVILAGYIQLFSNQINLELDVGVTLQGSIDAEWTKDSEGVNHAQATCSGFGIGGKLEIPNKFLIDGGFSGFTGYFTFDKNLKEIEISGEGSLNFDFEIHSAIYTRVKTVTNSFDGLVRIRKTDGWDIYADIDSMTVFSELTVDRSSVSKITTTDWEIEPSIVQISFTKSSSQLSFTLNGHIKLTKCSIYDYTEGEEKILVTNIDINGDITIDTGYIPNEAKCIRASSVNGFDSVIPSITLDDEIILEINVNMNPGSSLEYWDWNTFHDGLDWSKDIYFDGTITITSFRITRNGETAEISGTLIGNNARLAKGGIDSDTNTKYIIRSSDGLSSASSLTFTATNVDVSGSFSFNGDLRTYYDKIWQESSGTGKAFFWQSENGYDGTTNLDIGNFIISGTRTLNAGYGTLSFDLTGAATDDIKIFGLNTDPNTFIDHIDITCQYGDNGIRISPAVDGLWADNFWMHWDFIRFPPYWDWSGPGTIGCDDIGLLKIEATEDGGNTWELVFPQDPVAHAGGPYYASTNEEITFDGSGSTGNQLQYRWDFDNDGIWDYPGPLTWSDSPYATHSYSEGGEYTVELQIREISHPLKHYSDTTTATINDLPVLSDPDVDPDTGSVGTTFTFWVTYDDLEGNIPTTKQVYIDGVPHDMTMFFGNPGFVPYHAIYKYSTTLSAGTHEYYFLYNDDINPDVRLPVTGSYSGPIVEEENQPPSLSNGEVDPVSGDVSTQFYYTVTYTDPEDDSPTKKLIYLDGVSHTMTHSHSGTQGSTYWHVYKYETTLSEGDHNYYFEFSDGNNPDVKLPSSGSYSGPYVNQGPSLSSGSVNPSTGDVTTDFTYEVKYTDPDGDAPSTKKVYIDNIGYSMTKTSGSYSTGAWYEYTTKLSDGSHNYYFKFNDGHNPDVILPNSPPYSGPTVTNLAPVLSNPDVDPDTGSTGTTFTFWITYDDLEGDIPTTKKVYIDGVSHDMTMFFGNPGFVPYHAVYKYSTTLSVGTHNYYFKFNDGINSNVRLPTSGSYSGPTVEADNQPPSLSNGGVNPDGGSTIRNYYFKVTYTDPEDDSPTKKLIYLDGFSHTMTHSHSGTQGSTYWHVYKYETTLTAGTHNYYFVFNDGHNSDVNDPSSGSYYLTVFNPEWVRATGSQDTTSWHDESKARDTSTSTYAYYNRIGDSGWCDYPLVLYFSPATINKLRINAKSGDHLERIKIQLFYDSDQQGSDIFIDDWLDNTNHDVDTGQYEINKVKIWFKLENGYKFGMHYARVYDFKVYTI